MGADGKRGCRGGNEQRSCEPPQADALGGRGDHTPPCAKRLTRRTHWRASASALIRLLSNVREADVAVAGLGRKT